MSEETSTPAQARPIRRFSIGLLTLLQIVFVILIFLGINFLSSQHYRPYDLSQDLGFTSRPPPPATSSPLPSNPARSRCA